jgi:hypothetical protein
VFGKDTNKTPEALEKLVRKRKAAGIVLFFAGMDEAERRALAPGAVALVKHGGDSMLGETKAPFAFDHDALACANLAAVATATMNELKKLGWRFSPPFWEPGKQELWLAILRDRAPDWIDGWAELLIEDNHRAWRFVRRMIRAGLCRPPESDAYVLGMIEGLWPQREGGSLIDGILAERELLDGLFWRLFEVEGGGEVSLANFDKFSADARGWAHAMRELATRGEIDRNRLLDASLEALARDFSQYRAGWFSRFHEYMEPNFEERAARTEHYLGLLASPIPPTVAFAVKALMALHKAKRLDGEAFVGRVEPVLYAKAKGTVKQALRLMTAFAKADDALARRAALIAAAGLEHPESEIQESALAFIEGHGDPGNDALREAVADRCTVVAAPLRPRIADWLGSDPTVTAPVDSGEDLAALQSRAAALPPDLAAVAGVDKALAECEAPTGEIASMPYNGLNAPRLSDEDRLAPVATLDDLIALFLEALERPGEVEKLELVLDGAARLCGQRPESFRQQIAPLAKRVATLRKRPSDIWPHWNDPRNLLIILADAWLSGDAMDAPTDIATQGVSGVFSLRTAETARLIAEKTPVRLLSIPTHRGGFIEPVEVVARSLKSQAKGIDTGMADRVLALLRLAPDGRANALRAAADIGGEWGVALRHALGGEEAVGESAAIWVAAARARSPLADEAAVKDKFPGLGPGAGEVGRLGYKIRLVRSDSYTFHYLDLHSEPAPPNEPPTYPGGTLALMPTVMAHRMKTFRWWYEGEIKQRDNQLAPDYAGSPYGQLLWPLNPNVLFASTAGDTGMHSNEPRPNSEPPYDGYAVAMDPDTPLTRIGRDMLCLGLNARDVAEGQMAVDLLIAAITDGRVTGPSLGMAMPRLLYSGFVKPKRWATRLTEAARQSPLHAQTVRLALEQALSDGEVTVPRDVHALMELLYELCVEASEAVTKVETRNFLSDIKGNSKAAQLARKLLAREEGDPLPHRRAAAALALAGRVERAERWTRRREAARP